MQYDNAFAVFVHSFLLLLTVADDELEMAGVTGPKCAKICFDDYVLKKQVTYGFVVIYNNNNNLNNYGHIFQALT